MAKPRSSWHCDRCGHVVPRWVGRCPECGEFGTFVEDVAGAEASATFSSDGLARAAVKLSDVCLTDMQRMPTGIRELDRVLGGGLVPGSVVLIGGEPGIGKSTLLLQAAGGIGQRGAHVLYVCGEESAAQVRSRADRVRVSAGVSLLPVVDVRDLEATVLAQRPDVVVVDSVQTLFDPACEGLPGSVGQIRATASRLVRIAKASDVVFLVVGHVTKDGSIAGPRILEHIVDTVLYFEGDSQHAFRIVRAQKNRFGPAAEVGIFEMTERGLVEVEQPSSALLAERGAGFSGSIVMPTMEGSRCLLVELQALVSPSWAQPPRRLSVGVDAARVLQVLAILERRAGMKLSSHDVYVSVTGGVRVTEPAVDLPIALAVASAFRDSPACGSVAAFGEVGLTGEVRGVSNAEARIRESGRMGFTEILAPVAACSGSLSGARCVGVASIAEAMRTALG